MKITCSAGKGEMQHTTCLACALSSGHAPCGFDYMILRSLFDDRSSEKRRSEIHVTDLTGCLAGKAIPLPRQRLWQRQLMIDHQVTVQDPTAGGCQGKGE